MSENLANLVLSSTISPKLFLAWVDSKIALLSVRSIQDLPERKMTWGDRT
jgi:hypothetical protein